MLKIGNCPDSWGVLFPDDPKQMGWERFLDEFQEAGYRYLELGPYGYLPTEPEVLKDHLERRRIQAVSGALAGHFENDLAQWREKIHIQAPFYQALGVSYFVLLDGRYSDRSTRELIAPKELAHQEWRNFVTNLTELSRELKEEYGLEPVFHPHADTHVETEEQIQRLLEETDPALVNLCFDTGHHVIAGGEPISFMERFGGRTKFLHIKNVNGSLKRAVIEKRVSNFESLEMGVYTELSKGEIDFKLFQQVMERWNYDGYAIIEQDVYPIDLGADKNCADGPLMMQTRNACYLEQIGFGRR